MFLVLNPDGSYSELSTHDLSTHFTGVYSKLYTYQYTHLSLKGRAGECHLLLEHAELSEITVR